MLHCVTQVIIAMTKLNWSCTFCGRTFSRRSSAQRHIDNYNIHEGLGHAVPYAEYSIGIREGKYWPQSIPRFTRSGDSFLDRAFDKITAEVENNVVRNIANRVYNTIADKEENKAIFDDLAKAVATRIIIKNVDSNPKGSAF